MQISYELYQPPDIDQPEARTRALLAVFEAGAPLSVADYEGWAALDWKRPHGSGEAAVRYAVKLVEEAGRELPGATTRAEKIDELGDVLYCATAALANCGVSLEGVLQTRIGMPHSAIQLQFIDSLLVSTANTSPFRADPPTVNRLDRMPLVQQSGVNYASIADPAEQFIATKAGELGFASIEAFGRAGGDGGQLDRQDKDALGQIGGDLFWAIAKYARGRLRTPLLDVARCNIVKVTGRVLAGAIDKADGFRP